MADTPDAPETHDVATSVVLIVGFAVSAAALILSIPPLFAGPGPLQVWLTAVFATFAVILAVATVWRRPPRRRPDPTGTDA